MKKKPLLIEEAIIWLRGRFTLTDEEKVWVLFILIICWAGLVSRYIYFRNQPVEQFSIEQIQNTVRP